MAESDLRTTRSQASGTLLAVLVTIGGAIPTFLTSALAVQLQEDLDFGPASLGLATSISFGVAGTMSRPMGRIIQRRGARFGFHLALTLSSTALTMVLVASSYRVLVAALALAGLGFAAAQPTANLLITQMVDKRRLGLAMGVKQSYIPIASLVGGLAVPVVAVQYGWRWAMGGAVVLCLLTLASGRRRTRALRARSTPMGVVETPASSLPRRGLLVLTMGAALASGSATALGIFLVDAAASSGVHPGMAGYLLAVCAACSLAGRVFAGWVADRLEGHSLYVGTGNVMLCTVAGMILLALGNGWLFVLGALLSYVGWCWPGLLHLAVVRDSHGAVATATGIVQTGFSGGAALGPVILGAVVESSSYRVAWLSTAAVSALGIVVIRWAGRIIRRQSRGIAD